MTEKDTNNETKTSRIAEDSEEDRGDTPLSQRGPEIVFRDEADHLNSAKSKESIRLLTL